MVCSNYGRKPLTGQHQKCLVTIDCVSACKLLLEDQNVPGVLAVDVEHYNEPTNTSWRNWPHGHKFCHVEKSNEHGRFVCMIQIASADGSNILYDLKGLIELLDNSRVT